MTSRSVPGAGGGPVVAAAVCALVVLTAMGPAQPPLSLVIVTLDTTRADRIGAYGGSRAASTPAIDRIAHDGVVFEDATTPVPLTLPAHCTLFTGRLPPGHGARENASSLGAGTPTLARALQSRGYRTGAFVGSVVLSRSSGLSEGFDVYDDHIPWRSGPAHPRRRADAVVDRAIRWMNSTSESPFFAWLHFYDAHAPYEAMAPFDRLYPGRAYEAAIASIDSQIARLSEYLASHGLTTRTILIIVGDHGEGLGEHGEVTHGLFLYQSVLRVPFILRGPSTALSGQRVTHAVSSTDLTPTVLDLLGVPPMAGLDGRSLAPMIQRSARDAPRDVYAENLYPQRRFKWSEMRAIRSGRLKLIDKTRPELYDLARDPDEAHDLSADHPDVVARLATRLHAWEARLDARAVGDRGPAVPVPADVRAALMSLGYVSDAAPDELSVDSASAPDPRERVEQFNRMMRQSIDPRRGGVK
jgi:arylsulfatase A-like enzyme